MMPQKEMVNRSRRDRAAHIPLFSYFCPCALGDTEVGQIHTRWSSFSPMKTVQYLKFILEAKQRCVFHYATRIFTFKSIMTKLSLQTAAETSHVSYVSPDLLFSLVSMHPSVALFTEGQLSNLLKHNCSMALTLKASISPFESQNSSSTADKEVLSVNRVRWVSLCVQCSSKLSSQLDLYLSGLE